MFTMRTNLKLRVSFYTRHGKTSKVEESPVMLRVSYEGRRATFGQVPIEVSPRDFGNGRVFVTHPNAKALNEQLDEIEADICFLAKDLYKKGILSIDTLLQAYRGEKSPSKYISALFDEMISDEKKKCEAGLVVKGTYNRYLRMKSTFLSFLGYNHRKDLQLSEVNKQLMADYEYYLTAIAGYSYNTLIKNLRFVVSAMHYATSKGYMMSNPLSDVTYKEKTVDRGFLTLDELQTVQTVTLPAHLDLVRDVFLFSCYTGISYRDVYNLTDQNVITVHGTQWIVFSRQKTKQISQVPLLDKALSILSKYADRRSSDGRLLPVFCNQVINRHLKQIAQHCNIEKPLSFHIARHTFATLSLTYGVSMETVSQILGHSSLRTTQHYGRILPQKVEKELSGLNAFI